MQAEEANVGRAAALNILRTFERTGRRFLNSHPYSSDLYGNKQFYGGKMETFESEFLMTDAAKVFEMTSIPIFL